MCYFFLFIKFNCSFSSSGVGFGGVLAGNAVTVVDSILATPLGESGRTIVVQVLVNSDSYRAVLHIVFFHKLFVLHVTDYS